MPRFLHLLAPGLAVLCADVASSQAQQPEAASGLGVRLRFEASPTHGAAPLAVTFSTYIPGNFSMANGVFSIQFGDGASAPNPECFAPADSCKKPGQVTHTYVSAGAYTARLVNSVTGTVNSVRISVGGRRRP